jgi:mono/diheme cytochrome c family protein
MPVIKGFRPIAGSVALIVSLAMAPVAKAELTTAQKKAVAGIAQSVREAGTLFQAGDFEESGKRIESAVAAIEKLVAEGGAEAYDAVSPAFPRIVNAQALLELEGVVVPPFAKPERPETMRPGKPDKPEPAATPRAKPRSRRTTPDTAVAVAGPSFVRQVAPILVQHCGQCHINRSQGDFSMATFAMLAKGPPEGTVIFPGDVVASRLIETIETGDMPRGGGKVPAEQFQLLKDWIVAGAKYDAPSPLIPLAALASASPAGSLPAAPMPAAPADPAVRQSTGEETVSFAKDIAPILIENCNGCHIDAMQVRGGLRMDTFAALMRGGDSGEIVMSGDAVASLLVRKIKGEEGARMPAGGRAPLSDSQIALISKWIDENATFDGAGADRPLRAMASQAWADSASDDELNARRAELARKNLLLVGTAATKLVENEADRFFVIGDVGDATAKAVATAATKALAKIKPTIDPSSIRGRVTIFVMPKRYDYSEFAKMVEGRGVPSDWQSHWRYDGVDAYIALLAAPSESDTLIEARLAGPLASLAVATRGGDVPRWFAEGVGRATTARLYAKDFPNVEGWNSGLFHAVAAMKDGGQFIKNELPPESTDVIGYAILSTMIKSQRKQFDNALKNLNKGAPFDQAFAAAFGVAPAAYVDRWKPYAGQGLGGKKR